MEEKKDCFGRHIYEDMECMMCPDDSMCNSATYQKERQYYLNNKLKKNPECKDCIQLTCGRKCSKTPKYCIGKSGEYENNKHSCCDTEDYKNRCICKDHCLHLCLEKSDTIHIHCKRTINLTAYSKYGGDCIFYHDTEYECKVLYEDLYFNDNKIFKNYKTNKIFNTYFKIC